DFQVEAQMQVSYRQHQKSLVHGRSGSERAPDPCCLGQQKCRTEQARSQKASPADLRFALSSVVVDETLRPGCNPASRRSRWGRDADEEERVIASRRDAGDVPGKLSVALLAERNRCSVKNRRCWGAGVAHQRACNGGYRTGRSARVAAVEDQSVYVEE